MNLKSLEVIEQAKTRLNWSWQHDPEDGLAAMRSLLPVTWMVSEFLVLAGLVYMCVLQALLKVLVGDKLNISPTVNFGKSCPSVVVVETTTTMRMEKEEIVKRQSFE